MAMSYRDEHTGRRVDKSSLSESSAAVIKVVCGRHSHRGSSILINACALHGLQRNEAREVTIYARQYAVLVVPKLVLPPQITARVCCQFNKSSRAHLCSGLLGADPRRWSILCFLERFRGEGALTLRLPSHCAQISCRVAQHVEGK